jgi:hypothetical protein
VFVFGTDSSSNGNNYTTYNLNLDSGSTYDSMLDSPTDIVDSSGNSIGNYPTFDPSKWLVTQPTITNGNLTWTTNTNSSNNYQYTSMKMPTSGKWYSEFTVTQANIGSSLGYGVVGIEGTSSYLWWVYSSPYYQIQGTGGSYSTIPTISSGDVIMVAIDMDAGKAWYGQNGTWLLSGNPANGTAMSNPATFTPGNPNLTQYVDGRTGSAVNIINANFGQRAFSYTPPTGFRSLNTKALKDIGASNLPDTFGNFVNTPDLVWIKSRSAIYQHNVYDTVRGATNTFETQNANAAYSLSGLTAFKPNGFDVGSNAGNNNSGSTFVSWAWNRGQTPGFDIVSYGGNGSTQTINHNLGQTPAFMIVKAVNAAAASWGNPTVYHKSVGPTQYINLNTTAAAATGYNTAPWANTSPNSTNFTVTYQAGAGLNGTSDSFIAYLWAEVPGFSKFGSYTGNGSADGPFVYCGFKPRWIMVKSSTSVQDWKLIDTARNPANPATSLLGANINSVEDTNAVYDFDILSNGFKIRNTYGYANTSSQTYIYAAFAESPFKYSNAR